MRNKKDPALGERVRKHLEKIGKESPINRKKIADSGDAATHIASFLESLGVSLENTSTKETPKRVLDMYKEELFSGLDYANFPKVTVTDNDHGYYDHVIRKAVPVKSMCEHHLMPIVGSVTIGYIPDERVIGLSKIDRIVDFFCRRPQIQERLTQQIMHALIFILETEDVGVIMSAEHFCVSHRGVGSPDSTTKTIAISGKFFSDPSLKQELLLNS